MYRLQTASIIQFIDKLSDLDDALSAIDGRSIILGKQQTDANAMDSGPSRLHLIAESENAKRLSNSSIVGVSSSDDSSVKDQLQFSRPTALVVSFSSRDYNKMETLAFSNSLRCSVSLQSPPAEVDDAVRQFEVDIRTALDRTCKKPQEKHSTCWLLPKPTEAKKNRHCVERQFTN